MNVQSRVRSGARQGRRRMDARAAATAPLLFVGLVLLGATACEIGETPEATLAMKGSRPADVSPLFQPLPERAEHPEDNPGTPERIDLGHKLFFEPKLSRAVIISCNTCHVVGAAGVDAREVAIGEGARTGPRNSPSVYNAAFLSAQFWDGRAPTLEEQGK